MEHAQWQPIETAPKDGTEILALCRLGSAWMHGLVSYDSWESEGQAKGVWSTTDGGYVRDPILWMPLPQPPEVW